MTSIVETEVTTAQADGPNENGRTVWELEASRESPVPPHPLGVKPLGNQYFAHGPRARESLGSLQALPDEMLMAFLEYLDGGALRVLGYSCKFLFAFCVSEELWKAEFLE